MRLAFAFLLAFASVISQHHGRPRFNNVFKSMPNLAPWDFNADIPVGSLIEYADDAEARAQRTEAQSSPEAVLPRFLFNQANGVILRPNMLFRVRTLVKTTTKTTTLSTLVYCIPQSFFTADVGNCNRRRRDIERYLDHLIAAYDDDSASQFQTIEPAAVREVETTAAPSSISTEISAAAIASSKDDAGEKAEGNDARRLRRFFYNTMETTLTEWSFSTTTLTRQLSIAITQNGALCPQANRPLPLGFVLPGCYLACLPPGYKTC